MVLIELGNTVELPSGNIQEGVGNQYLAEVPVGEKKTVVTLNPVNF